MFLGFGWCVLRTSREAYRHAQFESVDELDNSIDAADRQLWTAFREWMGTNHEPFLKWQFFEELNNHRGLLQFCVSRNHRQTVAWRMLDWIAANGTGSFGLFYAHDDERVKEETRINSDICDSANVFRVHRIANGVVTELADPFLSPLVPFLNPSDLA